MREILGKGKLGVPSDKSVAERGFSELSSRSKAGNVLFELVSSVDHDTGSKHAQKRSHHI